MVLLLILFFVAVALFEMPLLIQKKYWRDLIVVSVILGMGFCMSLLLAMGITPPNPNLPMIYIFKEILHLSY